MKKVIVLVMCLMGSANALEFNAKKYEGLVKKRAYDGAFKYLESIDADDKKSEIVALKSDIATHYFAYCLNLMTFAFVDLKDGQRIVDVRGKKGTYKLYSFELEKVIEAALRKDPQNPKLMISKADLSYSGICGFKGLKRPEMMSLYQKAHKKGHSTFRSNHNLAVLLLGVKKNDEAIALLRKSVSQNPDYPNATYNLAYLLDRKGNLKEATPLAERAFTLYRDKKLKSEAALMSMWFNKDLGNLKKARYYAGEANKNKFKNHYNIYKALLEFYLAVGDMKDGNEIAGNLFALAPKNPTIQKDILFGYLKVKKEKEAVKFFNTKLKEHKKNKEVTGGIHFTFGVMHDQKKDKKSARAEFLLAKSDLAKVLPATHPVFKVIEQQLGK